MGREDDTWEPGADWAPGAAPAQTAESGPVAEGPAPREGAVLLGQGGMGQVWRVRDPELRRHVALKVLRPGLGHRPEARARFLAEAQLTAQLDHPGIVPVYAMGIDDDGQPWFTMKEVRGRTLEEVAGELSPREHLDVLRRVCEAVASAHARGVVHRDLKPANVMLGAFGEVLVLDWGIAREEEPSGAVDTVRSDLAAQGDRLTRLGRVPGTPGYVAPELLEGAPASPRSDVFALGQMLAQVALPLEEVVARCSAVWPDERPADASVLGRELAAWLSGEAQRERAHELLQQVQQRSPEVRATRGRAATVQARAEAMDRSLPPGAALDTKRELWALQDEAEALLREAALLEVEVEAGLRGALAHAPDDPIVHAALAEHHLDRLIEAREAARPTEALREEALLRRHLGRVPPSVEAGQRARTWLRGTGRVRLRLDRPVPGRLLRFEEVDRRLRAVPSADLGVVDAVDLELPYGSYLLELGQLRLPFYVERLTETRWRAPGEPDDRVIVVPHEPLPSDQALVPEGWFIAGGDAAAPQAAPRMQLWVERFVMQRHPVVNGDYLAFLNELVARGDETLAMACVPRASMEREPLWGRDTHGRFYMRPDEEGDEWPVDWPIAVVDFDAASAFASWYAASTGLPWRLPTEWEWEKAARGADGRAFPWGDRLDRDFCRNVKSQGDYHFPASPDDHPEDVSVYGVRHLGGNFHDWCASPWDPVLAAVDGQVAPGGEVPATKRMLVIRGASWNGRPTFARAASRIPLVRNSRAHVTSFRLVRSV